LTTICWIPAEQSKLILLMQVCGQDFQSVQPNPSAAAAAVLPADQAAVDPFSETVHTPAQFSAGGIFLPGLPED
jgi:hypothetical protein